MFKLSFNVVHLTNCFRSVNECLTHWVLYARMVKWIIVQIPVRVCWFSIHTLCPNDPSSWITNSTSKKGIVLSSFCISNVNLIEGCKLLMCSRNRWRFSRLCAQLLNVSSTYLNQNPGFNVEVAKAFFSNSFHEQIGHNRWQWTSHWSTMCLFIEFLRPLKTYRS